MQVGDKIKIIHMDGEPNYTGKIGIITLVGKDCSGDTYFRGTWGGLSIYPDIDDIENVSD